MQYYGTGILISSCNHFSVCKINHGRDTAVIQVNKQVHSTIFPDTLFLFEGSSEASDTKGTDMFVIVKRKSSDERCCC